MNENIIMGMIAPCLKRDELTYHEFEQIFSMLSLQEQYTVIEILLKKNIELVESYRTSEKSVEDVREGIRTGCWRLWQNGI